MSLVAEYSNSSSSSSDQSSSSNENVREDNNKNTSLVCNQKVSKQTLPSANQLLTGHATNTKTGDVFSNPFLEAEKAKTASLEQHVKMVNKDEHLVTKNGRKICWNYRKGRCRFGSNCHYAHDSDLCVNAALGEASERNDKDSKLTGSNHSKSTTKTAAYPLLEDTSVVDIDSNALLKKRKRPGLSDTITPNKRVLKAYCQEQQHGKKQQRTRQS